MMILSLIGFMGCGKSSVGRRLSELLCCPFMDLDREIEKKTGKTVSEIFSSEGEAAFRQLELQELKRMVPMYSRGPYNRHASEKEQLVLALGGGTVMIPECAEIVRDNSCCIYLRASVDTLLAHLEGETADRPMLNVSYHCEESEGRRGNLLLHDRITTLMALRSATYEKTAHVTIDTDGSSIEEIAQEIRSFLRGHADL